MSIRLVVTRGYGNGTFNGTIKDVVTRGYGISDAVIVVATNRIDKEPTRDLCRALCREDTDR